MTADEMILTVEILQKIIDLISNSFIVALPFAIVFMICQKLCYIMMSFFGGKEVKF